MAAFDNKQNESMGGFELHLSPSKTDREYDQSHHSNGALSSDSDLESRQPEEDCLESSDASGDELGSSSHESDLEHPKATLLSSEEPNGYNISQTCHKSPATIKGNTGEGESSKNGVDVEGNIPKYQYAKSSNKKFLRSNDMLHFKIKATNVDRYVRENNVEALETMAAVSYMATLTYADSKLELVVIGEKATKQIVQCLLDMEISQETLMFYLTRRLNRECHNVRMTVASEYARQMIRSDNQEEMGDWKERSVIFSRVPAWAAADLFEVLIPGAKKAYRSQNRESCFVVEFASPAMAQLFMKACREIRLQQHPLTFCLAPDFRDVATEEVNDAKAVKMRKRKISTRSTDSSEMEESNLAEQGSLPPGPPAGLAPQLPTPGLPDPRKPQTSSAALSLHGAQDSGTASDKVASKKRKFEQGGSGGGKGPSTPRAVKSQGGWGKNRKSHTGGRGSQDAGHSPSPRGRLEESPLGGTSQESPSPLLQQQISLLQQNMTFLTQAMMVGGLGMGAMGMGMAGGRAFFPGAGGGGGGGRGMGAHRSQGPRFESRRNWGGSRGQGRRGGFQDKRGRLEAGGLKCRN